MVCEFVYPSMKLELLTLLQVVLSGSFLSLPTLGKEDLTNKGTELVYIYYSRPDIRCPACEEFNLKIPKLQNHIPIRRINFFEDPKLASRFYTLLFPSFVIRSSGRSYFLPVNSFEELEDVIVNEKWRSYKPTRWYLEVDSYLTEIYAMTNFLFFKGMQKSYVVIDMVPSWVVTLLFSTIIVYMVHSIYIVFTLPVKKEKEE